MKLKAFLILTIIIAISCGLLYAGSLTFKNPFNQEVNYSDILVKRVIDGDTLLLENKERVRLIGIDTPEMHD